MSEEKNTEATIDSILAFRNKVPVEKMVLEGAGVIFIHGFTGLEKAQWQKECKDPKGGVNSEMVEPLMFQMCVRDAKGVHKFKYLDIPKLRELPCAILTEVVDVCMRLSGMGPDADEAILKNFEEVAEDVS